MAESTSSVEVRGELSCSVCLERFQEPKVLPCCHSFCLKCLEGTLQRSKDKTNLTCPQCRTQHKVPQAGLQGFLDDYTITNTTEPVDIVTSMLTCQECGNEGEVVSYCHTCKHLCQDCSKLHKQLKNYHNHKVIENVNLDESTPTKDTTQTTSLYCREHPEEHLKLYCGSCQELACLRCFVESHNGHGIGYIDDKSRENAQKVMEELVAKTESVLGEFQQDLDFVAKLEQEKAEGPVAQKDTINRKADSMIAQIEASRTQLLKKVDDFYEQNLKDLWAQKEYQEASIVSMKTALNFAKSLVQCEDNTKMLALCSQVLPRLKVLSQLKWDREEVEKVQVATLQWQPDTAEDVKVGKVEHTNCPPSVEIKISNAPTSIKRSESITIEVTTDFRPVACASPCDRKIDERIQLKGTAQCRCQKLDQLSGNYYYRTGNLSVSVARKEQNTWIVRPSAVSTVHSRVISGTITLTLRAEGMYGGQKVTSQETTITISVQK